MQPPSNSTGQPALSVLVLLPALAHMTTQNPFPLAPISRPSPLINRKSGSTLPSLKSIDANTPQTPSRLRIEDPSPDVEPNQSDLSLRVPPSGRRSSLAPGLGGGTETRSPDSRHVPKLGAIESSPPETPDRSPSPSPHESVSASVEELNSGFKSYQLSDKKEEKMKQTTSREIPEPTLRHLSTEAPAFVSGSPLSSISTSGTASRTRRRPVTAAGSRGIGQSTQRGSMALPSGTGLGIGAGMGVRNRPGWEADEVVSNLRASGLEVTLVRNTSHLPSLLSSPSGSASIPQSISARPSQVSTVTPVILVPLCDSPSIPSLSLLLAQGTTPTAVCFQQDLLERARQTEQEWLPSALAQIKEVVSMRDYKTSSTYELPIILAYSANPALNPTTTQLCIAAGAAGVIKPPFHGDTSRLVKRMVRAAREGRISSVVELPRENDSRLVSNINPALPLYTDEGGDSTKVVLPPTALDMGGEHEGEKVLSAAMTHMRQNSINTGTLTKTLSNSTQLSLDKLSPSDPNRRRQDMSILTPTTARQMTTTTPTSATGHRDHLPIHPYVASMSRYRPTHTPRRRSVDVGCLSLALDRATTAFEGPLAVTDTKSGTGFTFPPPSSGMKRGKTQVGLSRKSMGTPGVAMEVEHDEESTETHLAELLSAMYRQSTDVMDVGMEEYEELSAPMTDSHRRKLVGALETWDFKPHELDDGDLYRVATLLFEAVLGSEGLVGLGIDRAQMNGLLYAIKAIYHAPNPYHNYVHAIDVLQATYSFLMDVGVVPPLSYLLEPEPREPWQRPDEDQKPVCGVGTRRAREVLRPQDVFAVLVAAMGHDVGHPGLSNAFMKNAKTPLSEVFDDKSVLENMHCMLVARLLRRHGLYYLTCPKASAKIPTFEALGFRKVLYSSILATDMSLHFAWIARLKEFGATLQSGKESSEEDDRIMLCQAIIKCADISNPTRPIDVSEHWSSVLLEEWAKQASLEQDLDLPVSVIGSADAALQAKGQIGFIDLFTQPLFEAVSEILPELHEYASSCAYNRALWQTRLDEFTAQPDTLRLVVQPAIEGASADERFRSLIPLLLPVSLLDSTQTIDTQLVVSPSGLDTTGNYPSTPPSSNSYSSINQQHSLNTTNQSPSTKAMRAVYHTNLLQQRHRLSTWVGGGKVGIPIPGVGGIDLDYDRRLSTPGGVL